MKTILQRKDKTSIFCPVRSNHPSSSSVRTKAIEITIAWTLIIVGLSMILFTQ
ncbi:MAG: hypothetical protein JW840_03650 [Candidatus Thermoplasmatota archaeon]|nr:hypothetical protein [Candidatus Thermoplasmatota archaeon]